MLQMQSGPNDDINRIYLYVNIIDDFGGYTTFNMADSILVVSNYQYMSSLISQLNDNNKSSSFIQDINIKSIKFGYNIIAVGDALNQKSSNDLKVLFFLQ